MRATDLSRPSFSDSDTTGTSSDTTDKEGNWRTQSDYDDAWVMQLVHQVDVLVQEMQQKREVKPTAANAWTALKNVIDMHHTQLRELRRALEDAEHQVLVSERARIRAETQLQHLTNTTARMHRDVTSYLAHVEAWDEE